MFSELKNSNSIEKKVDNSSKNDISTLNTILTNKLTNAQFKALSEFVYKEIGIKMPEIKKIMLESRLHRRLRETNISNFTEYLEYVFSAEGKKNELINMFDAITTNKTDFFREPSHFDFLKNDLIPEITTKNKNRILKIWSAGCSTGEEPYTLAMVLNDMVEENKISDFSILGTDISTKALQHAVGAVYTLNQAEDIPFYFKKKYVLKSKDPSKQTIRISPLIRNKVTFQRLNFMDEYYDTGSYYDIIFCRNVIIYFDRITQEKVIKKLSMRLKPSGYFFLGHSESITNMKVDLEIIKPTIYRKINNF